MIMVACVAGVNGEGVGGENALCPPLPLPFLTPATQAMIIGTLHGTRLVIPTDCLYPLKIYWDDPSNRPL